MRNLVGAQKKMKQSKIIRKIYKACIDHDAEKVAKYKKKEFKKIFKRKEKGKTFDAKWTVVKL
jgi:hypothetical protein